MAWTVETAVAGNSNELTLQWLAGFIRGFTSDNWGSTSVKWGSTSEKWGSANDKWGSIR